jgi:hypothetical protein
LDRLDRPSFLSRVPSYTHLGLLAHMLIMRGRRAVQTALNASDTALDAAAALYTAGKPLTSPAATASAAVDRKRNGSDSDSDADVRPSAAALAAANAPPPVVPPELLATLNALPVEGRGARRGDWVFGEAVYYFALTHYEMLQFQARKFRLMRRMILRNARDAAEAFAPGFIQFRFVRWLSRQWFPSIAAPLVVPVDADAEADGDADGLGVAPHSALFGPDVDDDADDDGGAAAAQSASPGDTDVGADGLVAAGAGPGDDSDGLAYARAAASGLPVAEEDIEALPQFRYGNDGFHLVSHSQPESNPPTD